jgi:hypothetical protein
MIGEQLMEMIVIHSLFATAFFFGIVVVTMSAGIDIRFRFRRRESMKKKKYDREI